MNSGREKERREKEGRERKRGEKKVWVGSKDERRSRSEEDEGWKRIGNESRFVSTSAA